MNAATIKITDHNKTFCYSCKYCHRAITQGRYTVDIDITGKVKKSWRCVMNVTCCNHSTKIPMLFDSIPKAEEKRREVLSHIQEFGSLKGFCIELLASAHELN